MTREELAIIIYLGNEGLHFGRLGKPAIELENLRASHLKI
jgi:hypothetical protein